MPLIGTAGHVDHGKSTIVSLLTGRDPDRWAEEKRRGLTIDLGFAWTTIEGSDVSFVDVPGHERYSKNMLAGVVAMDAALLIVAANEGWMPQTEEHLAVLDLLGIHRALIVISKADLVDEDTLELAQLEVEDQLGGTGLAGSKVLVTSAGRPETIENLRSAIGALLTGVTPPSGRARMWIDRSFSVAGAGTVVTGSLIGSTLQSGEAVEIYPKGLTSKIRSIQSHENDIDVAHPGSRVALGLVGTDTTVADRGSMLGSPGAWLTSDRFTASISRARYVEDLSEQGSYQVHFGTTVRLARLRIEQDVTLIKIDSPVPLAMGDQFILRDTGRRLVVGGGRVLDPNPGPTSTALRQARSLIGLESRDERATALLEHRGWAPSVDLTNYTDGGSPPGAPTAGGYVMSTEFLDESKARVEEMVSSFHETFPLRAGMPSATLEDQIGLPAEIVDLVVESADSLIRQGPDVALRSHGPELTVSASAEWDRARELLQSDLAVPSLSELGLDEELVHLLARNGDLIKVSNDLVYLPSQMARIERAVSGLDSPFQVGELKDALGLSRKYVMPILEWLDSNEKTLRRPEGRVHGPALSGGDD